MPIDLYPSVAKVKRNGVYENLPGFVQASDDNEAQQMIAIAEDSTTAEYAHPEGSYFRLNGVLYKATANIGVGNTIAIGSNCQVAVLGDDVSDLADDIQEINDVLDDVYYRYSESSIAGLSLNMFDPCPSLYTIVQYQDTDCIKHGNLTGSGFTWLISQLKDPYKDIKFKLHYGGFSANPSVKIVLAYDGTKALCFNLNPTSGNVGLWDSVGTNYGYVPGIDRNTNCRSIVADDTLHCKVNGTKVAIYLVDNGFEIPLFDAEFVDIVEDYGSYGFDESDIGFGLASNNVARNEYLMYDFSHIESSGDHFMSYDETDARLTALENGYVRPGVVDLFMFMGQSNMAGRGNSSQAPEIIEGSGYEFRAISDPTKLYPISEPFGVDENVEGAIYDYLGENKAKSGSLVTAFVNAYYTYAKYPIVGVSASEGGTRISQWQPNTDRYNDAVSRYNGALTFLNNNNMIVRHKYILWCQGESDGDDELSKADYKTAFNTMAQAWFNNGIEKIFIIKIGNYNGEEAIDYDDIMTAQNEICQSTPNVIMASTDFAGMKARGLMKDAFHYTQAGYNEVGDYAGVNVAINVNTGKEPTMYDTQDGTLYYTHKN